MVGQSAAYMLHMIVSLSEERGNMLVIHRIIDRGAFAPGFYQATITQKTEMMGDARLRDTNDNRQVAYAQCLTG